LYIYSHKKKNGNILMILLVSERNIYKYVSDYMCRLRDYLTQNCGVKTDICMADECARRPLKKYNVIVFRNNILNSVLPLLSNTCKVYFMNTAQMTTKKFLTHNLTQLKNPKLTGVVDYSTDNIEILKDRFKHLKFVYFPYPINMQASFPSVKSGIVTLNNTPRRKAIISRTKIPMKNFAGLWDNARDKYIANCKILVNIHAGADYNVLESIRCYPALETRTLVISETCRDTSSEMMNDFIIYTTPDKMADTIKYTMENYQQEYSRIFSQERITELAERQLEIYKKSLEIIQCC